MDAQAFAFLFSAMSSGAALVGSAWVVRRYQQMGGGEAQVKVNAIRAELVKAFEAKTMVLEAEVVMLRGQVRDRDAQIVSLQSEITSGRIQRMQLQQDIDDLRQQVRQLRIQITGNGQ